MMLPCRALRRALGVSARGLRVAQPPHRPVAAALSCRAPGAGSALLRRLWHCSARLEMSSDTGADRVTSAARQAPPAKRTDGRMQWNVHHAVVVQRQPLTEVFTRLQAEVRARGLRANAVRQAVDTFFHHCALRADSAELASPAFRAEVLGFFRELFAGGDRPFALGETLNEASFAAVIRLQLAWHADAREAWALVDELQAATGARLHFRTVGPVLESECRRGGFRRAFERWQRLKRGGVEWTASMEDSLVVMAVACLEQNQRETSDEFHAQMRALLHDLQLASREVSWASAQRLRAAFDAAGFATRVLPSDAAATPACSSCGAALLKAPISDEERRQMLAAIESRPSKDPKPASEHLAPFREWLLAKHARAQARGKLHYVLDGPNIAYINQNFDAGSNRLDQVDLVARRLLAEGHEVSITMPAAYLADSFVLRIRTRKMKAQRRQGQFTTRRRSAEEKALIEGWRRDDLVFSCRTDVLSDDLFWLYASVLLGNEGRVVTNDQGRDHVFAMLSSARDISRDLIERWKDEAIVNIEIQHEEVPAIAAAAGVTTPIPVEEVRLLHPLPFSRVPQVSACGRFHVPIAPPESAQPRPTGATPGVTTGTHRARVRRKWLCAHRDE